MELSAEVEAIENDLGWEQTLAGLISHAPLPAPDEFFALGLITSRAGE